MASTPAASASRLKMSRSDPFHVPVRSPASRRKASSFGRNAVSGSEPSARTLTGESESAFRTAVTAASRMS